MNLVREKLSRYVLLKKETENCLERLARMRSNAELPALKQGEGSRGAAGNRVGKAVEECLEYEARIRPIVEMNQKEMREIESAVKKIKDPLEREVLWLRYIEGEGARLLSWKEVAYSMTGACSDAAQKRMKRIHRKAIEKVLI